MAPKLSKLKKIGFHYKRPSSGVVEHFAELYTSRDCDTKPQAEKIVREYIDASGKTIEFARITKIERMGGNFIR